MCWQWAVGWDAECGGVWWEVPAKTQKNAVTNLEMLLAGTREYRCEYRREYRCEYPRSDQPRDAVLVSTREYRSRGL